MDCDMKWIRILATVIVLGGLSTRAQAAADSATSMPSMVRSTPQVVPLESLTVAQLKEMRTTVVANMAKDRSTRNWGAGLVAGTLVWVVAGSALIADASHYETQRTETKYMTTIRIVKVTDKSQEMLGWLVGVGLGSAQAIVGTSMFMRGQQHLNERRSLLNRIDFLIKAHPDGVSLSLTF
jgi:hypothetical protein